MKIDITIKNYRCFADSNPAQITLDEGCFIGLVGINNSGKSSLLRFFHEFRDIFSRLSNPTHWPQIFTHESGYNLLSVPDSEEIFYNGNNRALEIIIKVSVEEAPSRVRILPSLKIIISRQNNYRIYPEISAPLEQSRLNGTILVYQQQNVVEIEPYIRAFKQLSNSMYVGAFRNVINVGAGPYYDIQVGQAFIQQWANYQTGPSVRNRAEMNTLTKAIQDIFGFSDFVVWTDPSMQNILVRINNRPHRLMEMGSGLAQFLLVFMNAAVKKPAYILIDEPELNLHPALQQKFLEALASYASNNVLFSTHNLGLARTCADKIYSVKRGEDGTSKVSLWEKTPLLSELIGELSFSSHQELGFEGILLVEGATEVRTIHQFLRSYKLDHKYVTVPLGGSQLIKPTSELELQELKRIVPNVIALIDSEKSTENESLAPNRQGFVDACKKIGIRCHVLKRRATENYLSEAAIKKVKGDKYRALTAYENLKEANPHWAKSENWRIAFEMNKDDLKATDLEEFLLSL